MHSHFYFEIIVLVTGSCTNKLISRNIDMISGDICILAPQTQHTITNSDDDCVILNLMVRASTFDKAFFGILTENDFLSTFFTKALNGSESEENFIVFNTGDDSDISKIITKIYLEEKSYQKYRKLMQNSLISQLFITLLRKHSGNVLLPQRCRIEKASELLLDSEMSISEISELTGFQSLSHFYKTFNKFEQKSPAAYRINQ